MRGRPLAALLALVLAAVAAVVTVGRGLGFAALPLRGALVQVAARSASAPGLASAGAAATDRGPPGIAAVAALASAVGLAALVGAAGGRRQRRAAVAQRAADPRQEELKRQAGYRAVDDYVRSGTTIGLGTGSTAKYAVERVGQKLKSGELRDIVAIPTSKATQAQAEALGIPLATLDTHSKLAVAIDGADDVDRATLDLTKGGGGALFREKIVEQCAEKFIVIADESKLRSGLGPGFPVPIEIVPFCHEHTMRQIAELPALAGCKPVLRLGNVSNNKRDGDKPAVTDNGNYIVDLEFTEPIRDVMAAAEQLKATVGVVEHGLFVGMTTAVILAGQHGIEVIEPKR